MVNYNKYILSSLDIQYIEYFYYVFPLHLNSFNRLFYHKLSNHTHILQQNIHFLGLPLTIIKSIKYKLDSSSSLTIKFLDSLNNHLNSYEKPNQENLKSIIDSFVKILISGIQSDSDKICQLKECIQKVTPQLTSLKDYLNGIITQFSKEQTMEIQTKESYRTFFMGRYGLLKTRLKQFSDSIKPLCETLEQTITLLSNTTEVDSNDPKTFKGKLEGDKKYLDSTFKSTLVSIKSIQSLENIQYIQEVKNKLEKVKCMIPELKSSLSTKKDILKNFYKYYIREMVPVKTEDTDVPTYSSKIKSEHIKTANQQKLDELITRCDKDLESLQQFISNYTTHIQNFDTELVKPCECISAAIEKVNQTKSDVNKQKLIEYIINLIDTINVIISVEPSEIVKHLKPIYSIKHELKSIKSSIKTKDIENDISNLQNLYSEIVNIESFSKNMKKLKEYIASVEIHLGGIDYIVEGLKNINSVINWNYPKFYLEIFMEAIDKHKSNLKEDDPVKIYMNQIKHYIFILNYLVSMINENINKVDPLVNELKRAVDYSNSKMNFLASDITGVECAIDTMVRNFIRCSTKQLSINIGGLDINKTVVGMYSVLSVMDYEVLVNRMLEFWTFSDESVKLFRGFLRCPCRLDFEERYRNQRPSAFLCYSLPCIKTCDVNPVSEFGRQTMADNVGNHLCLCLVIKYHLRPTLLKCILYLRNEELGTLDTISRKFHRYNSWTVLKGDLWKLFSFVLNIIYELTSLLSNRYLIHLRNICMCSFYEKNYNNFVSIILVMSSLLENISAMDKHNIGVSIWCLSTLIRDFEKIDSDHTSDNSNNLKIIISGLYNVIKVRQTVGQNNQISITYSKNLKLNSDKLTINHIITHLLSLISLIRKLNTGKDAMNRLYQIFTSLTFEIVNKVDSKTTITITRSIGMNLSNVYLKILKETCGNDKCKKNESCKCGISIIYGLSILISNNKLISKMNTIKKAMKTLLLSEKIQFGQLAKIINSINIIPLNKLQVVKNNLLTSSTNVSINPLNTVKSRNWGYDTHFEHHVTNITINYLHN